MFPKLTIAARSDSIDAIGLTTYKPSLIVSCVDNARARASIKELMIQHVSMFAHGITKKPCWWIDCGNSYTHGQVAIGNWYSTELDDYVLEPATCVKLPLPTIQFPELLLQVDENEYISCAEQALVNGQSLNINFQMAIIAGEIVHQLLNSQLKRMQVVDEGRVKELLKSDRLSIGEIKKDLYGIRMPLILDRELPPIKLEFIAENRFELNPCEIGKLGLPLLNLTDHFTSKLLANADRYIDSSNHARDLIDLTILRLFRPIPTESILAAEANYRVRQPLIEAIVNFQNKPEWRASCYEALSVDNPVRIIDGLDELATDFEMEATERSFRETDFSYLETK